MTLFPTIFKFRKKINFRAWHLMMMMLKAHFVFVSRNNKKLIGDRNRLATNLFTFYDLISFDLLPRAKQ